MPDNDPAFSEEDDSYPSSASSSDHQEEHNASQEEEGEEEEQPDLSPEQTDKLLQLQSITGIEDLAICRALLDSKAWDLEATVREHLGEPSREEQEVRQRRREANRPLPEVPTAHNAHNHRVEAANNTHNQGALWRMFSSVAYIASLPIRWPLRLVASFLTNLYGVGVSVFGLPPIRGIRGGLGGEAARRNQLGFDPVAEVRAFHTEFEQSFGAQHPPFRLCSYAQALDEAKKELRFMVVYLHSNAHQDTRAFCADTLCTQEVTDFFAENNLLLWACSVEANEGARVSAALRESTYPFLAVIVLRQGKMMIVGRVEGAVARPEDLTTRMERIIRDNEAYVVAERAERAERTRNQSIREEQDRAFQETLRIDQERERKKQEELDRKKAEEEAEARLVQEEADRKERIRKLKIDLAKEIPDEPAKDDPDAIRVLVKLPEGQRLERRFLRTQSLKCLYFYVFCHPESPDVFDVVTNFPRKVLPCKPEEGEGAPDPPTFSDEGIGGSVMLFVNDLEGVSSGDEE